MNSATDLHRAAMDLVDRATIAKLHGEVSAASQLLKEAFTTERRAALQFVDNLELEPTRSVLFRSAASLALECGENRESERLISIALSGNPPDQIAEELRDLLEQVNLQRHLSLRGLVLSHDEVQFSLTGKSIGFGYAGK